MQNVFLRYIVGNNGDKRQRLRWDSLVCRMVLFHDLRFNSIGDSNRIVCSPEQTVAKQWKTRLNTIVTFRKTSMVHENEQTMNVLHCRRSFAMVLIIVLACFRSTTIGFYYRRQWGFNDMQAVTCYFAILVKGVKRTKCVAILEN